jgi:outer membrane protein OmpA-like peptidoglycan-associated protein
MRRSTLALLTAPVALALAVLGTPDARATSEDERPGEIGILAGAGIGDKALVGDANDTKIAPVAGIRLGAHFTERVAGFIEGTWTQYTGDKALFGDASELAFRVGPEWYVNPKNPWQFFVNVGIGFAKYKTDFGGDDGRGMASLGLGVRRGWKPGAFRIELRGDRTVSSAELANGKDFTAAKLMLGWTWGIGSRPKDTDGDGVFDKKDKCPDTPHGATVDAVGCPTDADGDGVFDGLDKCPDTPKGYPVDADGCPKDTDGDGVVDGKDTCANTVKGCTVDANGCPADPDNDGVCDGLDQCPNTTAGCRVDSRGCPIDSDGDGVCDGLDQCPGTPAGVTVDARGCPPPPPPPPPVAPLFTPEQKEFVLQGVKFDNNSAKLSVESTFVLDKVVDALKAYPNVKVQVGGHTDSTGSDAYNQKLSEQRAHAVRDYLVSKGASADNLLWKGYGESKPIADNKTADGRAKNRRVELHKME